MFQQDSFNLIYQKLNTQQKKAVDSIEGPVMVIAGPGTGKTQILSARIGKILLETDTQPENILCLTYTDAGTVAMRKRLASFIGSTAYNIHIHTFHSFCNEVIQENLHLFDKQSLNPISDLQKIILLKQLIDKFEADNPLKRYRGDAYYEVNPLIHLFSTMKKEGWTSDFIIQKTEAYIQSLPEREAYIYKRASGKNKAGDLKTDAIAEETEKKIKLIAAAKQFNLFKQMMLSQNCYDFDDMILWVIDVFENKPNVLRHYQEKYQYVMVDEFQDTNNTQLKIVNQLMSYWDVPNLFVVGDDDQCIYRFQDANEENLIDFYKQHQPHVQVISLEQNYRSTQPILDVAQALIQANKNRVVYMLPDISKQLVASHPNKQGQQPQPSLVAYPSKLSEMMDITLQIQQLLQQGVKAGKIGVIYRENKYGDELREFLQKKEIDVYCKRSYNLFKFPIVKQIILILQYIHQENDTPFSGSHLLFEILHFQFFKLPAITIANWCVEMADKQFSAQKTNLRTLLNDKKNVISELLITTPEQKNIAHAASILEELLHENHNNTLQEIVRKIIQETGLLEYALQQPNKHLLLQAISAFFEFVKTETHANPNLHVTELVNLMDTMQREGIELPLIEVIGTESAVNLMTAHGSKGLEFEYVFLVGSVAASWEKKQGKNKGYSFPDNLFGSTENKKDELSDLEELRRLFYVGITRAEKHLQISHFEKDEKNKDQSPTRFIAEIIEQCPQIVVEQKTVEAQQTLDFKELLLSKNLKPQLEKIEEQFVTRQLEKFTMNVTALNNYLKCPLHFYYTNILKVPSGKSEAAEFGNAVHKALQLLFENMQRSESQQFPSLAEFLQYFTSALQRSKEVFTPEQFNRKIEYGNTILTTYYQQNISQAAKIVSIERTISQVMLNNIPLKGKLDKLEFDGNLVNVVDYKTGDPDKAKEKLKAPKEAGDVGGDYWRQAVFYKILLDRYDNKKWKVVSTEFDFLEYNKKKQQLKQKVHITPEDVEQVIQQIKETWQHIQQRNFYVGCGKEDCSWCNFAKSYNIATLIDEENE